ncbi:MAG: nucleotidyltransferase domain-containing protein [bacterium]|nr:nucleotidyltransferase domain-containing protein [bacterium]
MARPRIRKPIRALVNAYLKELEQYAGLSIDAAYVFGSQTLGGARKASDIDVCVVSSKFKNSHEALRWLWRNKPMAFSKIEPVGYSRNGFNEFKNPLIAEIKSTGIRMR